MNRTALSGIFLIPAMIISLLTGCAKPSAVHLEPGASGKLDREVLVGIESGLYPGGVLMVGRGDTILKHSAYGKTGPADDAPSMSKDTVFDLASVSKVAGTATMSMLLMEDGILDPDSSVVSTLDMFGDGGKKDVRIHNLLTHTSGLKAYASWKKAEEIRNASTQDDALYRHISSLEKQYPTGDYIVYSCLNYLSLARLNETLAGESQQEFLSNRVWEPLGMYDTTYHPSEDQFERLAKPFEDWPDGDARIHDPLANYYSISEDHCSGNAGLYSTASDLSKYVRMILNRGSLGGVEVMKPETIEEMTTIHASLPKWPGEGKEPTGFLNKGYGWHVYEDAPWTHPSLPLGTVIGHTGYTGTFIWMDQESGVWIVFLANSTAVMDPPRTSTVRRKLTRVLLESEYGTMDQGG